MSELKRGWRIALPLLVIAGVFAVTIVASRAQEAAMRIVADPDVRVTFDGEDVIHMEAPVAASATDADVLYAGAELLALGRFDPTSVAPTMAQLYWSHDAGARWYAAMLPGAARGTWDNAMAAGTGGTAYFVTHASNADIPVAPSSSTAALPAAMQPLLHNALVVYRTDDGGVTWSAPSTTQNWNHHWDREYAVVDTTQSRFAGRLYIAGTGTSNGAPSIAVTSSSDRGQTFTTPVAACSGPAPASAWGAMSDASPLVLSDGTLVVPCLLGRWADMAPTSNVLRKMIGVVTSSDGGQTFSPFHRIGDNAEVASVYYPHLARGDALMLAPINLAAFAASPKSGAYPDRIYAVWSAFESDHRALYFTYSSNRGTTWTTPKRLITQTQGVTRANVEMIAVNSDGIVGIAWFDGRNASHGSGYDIYFTASTDGGNTFLTPVRVSSATSYPAHGTNVIPILDSSNANGMMFLSEYLSRRLGGDYSTMTADAAGRFHVLWPDARGQAWQLYTSTIRVLPSDALTRPVALQRCSLDSSIAVIAGAPSYDPASGTAAIPLHLVNTSANSLYGPLTLYVTIPAQFTGMNPALQAAFPTPQLYDPLTKSYHAAQGVVVPTDSDTPLFPFGVTRDVVLHVRGVSNPNVQPYQYMSFTLKTSVQGMATACKQQ